MPRGVPGCPEGAHPAPRQTEQLAGADVAVRQCGPLSGQLPAAPLGARLPQWCQMSVRCARRREPGGQTVEPPAGIGFAGAADHGGVRGVHRDPGAGGLPHLGRESVVVGVMVRDQDAVEIGEGEAAGADAGDEGVPGVRVVPAGVDEHRPAVGLQEVDEGVAERVVRDGDGDAPHPALVVGHLRRHPGPLSVWHTPGTRPSL